MSRATALLALAAVLSSAGLCAQSAAREPMPKTASGCLAALHAYTTIAADRNSASFAHRCADSVVAHGVRAADVPMLATLYDSAHDGPRAKAYLLLRDLGVQIVQAERASQNTGVDKPTRSALDSSELSATRLDALPSSVNDLKVLGHRHLLAESKAVSDRARTTYHARRVIDLCRSIRPRTTTLDTYISLATDDLAQALGDNGHADSALAVLDAARRDLGDASFKRLGLATLRGRYALVGRPAPPIAAKHWLNAPDDRGAVAVDRGKVTLIQFTGVSCAPCRASYPAMTALYNQFDHSRFDMVFVTTLTGEFEGKTMNPADELTATRDYYTKRYALPFRIAVNDAPPAPYVTSSSYYSLGIPQFVVIDKYGVVRWISVGWDSTSTTPLHKLITDLVAER